MERIVITNELAPGDVCAMTTAIKAWKEQYPNFELGYRGTAPELFFNNPHINLDLDPEREDVRVLPAHYPDIQYSHCRSAHFCEAYARYFSDTLRLPITLNSLTPDLYLDQKERTSLSPIHKLLGVDLPYWIIVPGHKEDCPIKGWEWDRWQQVVDHFQGRILFVQIGLEQFNPRILNGVVNMVGKTNRLRDLMVLMYHSQGVVCPITFPMHLCAGLRTPYDTQRPCVVIAGGREPAHWEAYPWHRYIDTVGLLSCCEEKGCWKNFAFKKGEPIVNRDHTCFHTTEADLPRCMDHITSELVCFEISRYFRHRLPFLTKPESKIVLNNEKGIIHHGN